MNEDRVPKSPSQPDAPAVGQAVDLDVTGLAVGGEGVARLDGRVVFVAGALPGERVGAEIRSHGRRFLRAETRAVHTPSPQRRALDCQHETDEGCGGCGMRHLANEGSLALRTESLMGELAKLGRPVVWPAPRLHPEPEPDGARWRLRLHLGPSGLGLYRRGSHALVRVPGCLAAHPDLLTGMAALEGVLSVRGATDALPEWVLLERADSGLHAYWPADVGPARRAALERLVAGGLFRGIRCRGRGAAVDLGDTWIVERAPLAAGLLEYRRRAGTFGQANPRANQALRQALWERLVEVQPARVLDLYAGSGNLTLPAARVAGRVRAVEIDPDAVAGLRASLRANGMAGVEVEEGDLEGGLDPRSTAFGADAVVLDPPRRGAPAAIEALARLRPPHLLYVSCAPTCLARDARALGAAYAVAALDAFDFFPRTAHVELMAHFVRR